MLYWESSIEICCRCLLIRLQEIKPSSVTYRTFKNADAMIDTPLVNPRYIGTALHFGVAPIGSLKNTIRNDELFHLIDASNFLNR